MRSDGATIELTLDAGDLDATRALVLTSNPGRKQSGDAKPTVLSRTTNVSSAALAPINS
jgi:hypothetical protein